VLDTQRKLADAELHGVDSAEAWNSVCPDAIRLSEAHCMHVLVRNFDGAVRQLEVEGSALCAPLRSCCNLFSLWWMRESMGDFLESGFLGSTQCGLLRQAVSGQLVAVRTDAVPLVDAWDHSDKALRSAIGKYDGRVYEALFASAQASVNHMNREVVDSAFLESLKPMRRSNL